MKSEDIDLEFILKKAAKMLYQKEAIKKELSNFGRVSCMATTQRYVLKIEIRDKEIF